jgi:BirA family transcriptional regulator, biotin operon repressor / biotin---[acetyl-CoA-carboxylase] ligase
MPSSIDTDKLKANSWIKHVQWHAELPSTQDVAKQLALRGDVQLPALVGADMQTAGRGRGSHRWWTGSGALALTLVVDTKMFGGQGEPNPQLSLAVGVSLVQAVKPHAPDEIVGLHWPNDVYCQNARGDLRKLAGVLIEAHSAGRVIIGVGINTNNSAAQAPVELAGRVVTLRDLQNAEIDQTAWLIAWLDELRAALQLLYSHPEEIGRQFQQYCLQIAKPLALRVGEQIHRGICRGIRADGALVLQTARGEEAFYSGTLADIE